MPPQNRAYSSALRAFLAGQASAGLILMAAASLALMPPGAERVSIEGATHAQFGDYGTQSGDGTPTISDEEARERLTDVLVPFLGAVGR